MLSQFDQGRSRCDGTIAELQMLTATYTSFLQSHSQASAALHALHRVIISLLFRRRPIAYEQMLVMLQREAALVEEMRAAAADFRQVLHPTAPHSTAHRVVLLTSCSSAALRRSPSSCASGPR
jgi:hypothetical protein